LGGPRDDSEDECCRTTGSPAAAQELQCMWVDGEYTLRVAKVKDTFPWHYHPNSDEGWFVYEGKITIQTRQGDIPLHQGEAVFNPKGLGTRTKGGR